MPSLEDVKRFRRERYEASLALVEKKGADYNRDQQMSGDSLYNMRVCELLGIVPSAEEGILVRLSDKLMRLISLTKPGREAAVKDESVLDTINDIHNYVDYLGLIWQQRRCSPVTEQTGQTVSEIKPVADNSGVIWKDGLYYRDGKKACNHEDHYSAYLCTLALGHPGNHRATDISSSDPANNKGWRS